MESNEKKAGRPFHICPECSAYNAKFLDRCWRCNHDLRAAAVEPTGVMGFRLDEMERASKQSSQS